MARVVSASLGASGPLLLKLADLLANECIRLKGVRREIRYLRSELASMDAALEGYTLIQDPNVQVKTWISLVRELAYDTEDCFDKFIHHLGNGGHHGSFKEFFRKAARQLKTLGSRRDIADQIDELKARVKLVKELKSSYKLDDIACSTVDHAAMDPRLSALFAEEAHLVGVDGPRDELAEWIMEEQDGYTSRRVLSIVGLGGLGKTTLANEVYRKIQGQFDCRALVSISQKPEVNKIVKDVISQVSCEGQSTKDIDSWDEKKSIAKLRALLQDKRYLIVIDDIWSISAWNDIKCAFPENNCSSKIIATTRIIDVARSCCLGCDDRIYDMQPLSDLYSKRLFLKRIFGSEDCCPDVLKGISNEILKKCGGLPLAIISISSLLANIPTVKDEWDRVKRSIGSALDNDKNLEAVNSILSLSYNNLSPNLKTCLLYLSNFPEDCVIERERLVRRWMAEGFIPDERGQSQQEVAESYFYKLINNSMIQPVDIGYDGKARACRIHDMMLELIILKSAEENFITVVNGGQTVWENPDCHIRRLSIQDIDHELASVLASKNLRHVRSLTITGPVCTTHLPSLSKFESLRVLDFEGCRSLEGYDMKNVDKLFQLKYLSFRGTKILKMPLGIVMLHDLETLDICETHIQGLPAGIVQLTKLQHLLVRTWGEAGGRTKIPEGIRNMSSLRVAQGFDIAMSSVGAIEELGYLTSLNQLDIELNGEGSDEYRRHEEMLLSSLCKLGNYKLHELRICSLNSTPLEFLDSWFPLPSFLRIFQMLSYYYLLKAPKCIAPELTNLAYLTINLVEVTQEDLCLLGKLHALLRLELWLKSHQKERLTVQGFPIIKEFIIGSLQWGGVCATFVKGGMPNLEKLHMTLHVSMVTTWAFYFGIEHLRYLKEATVHFYPMGAEYSETKAAAAVIRSEASAHPNYPKVSILKLENGGLINAED